MILLIIMVELINTHILIPNERKQTVTNLINTKSWTVDNVKIWNPFKLPFIINNWIAAIHKIDKSTQITQAEVIKKL